MTILERLKRIFIKKNDHLAEDIPAEEDMAVGYDTLTPKILTDKSVQEYFNALDFAFSKKDVKNIAITGPYGAGKSTVILSYLTEHCKTKFIDVSLADFSISGKSVNRDKDAQVMPNVEFSILQQILYKENKENLPDSRIDRIQNRNEKHINSLFLSSLCIALPILLLIFTIFTKTIGTAFGANEELILTLNSYFILRLMFSLVFGLFALYFVVKIASKAGIFDKKIKLSKIAFLQASAEASTQEPSSLLNNCLDEIVYFFSQSDYKIVLFEDLDRLENAEIFIKLREINQIVNSNIKGGPVRFVYACRDDIFLGSDVRTKFFDFILPVIPIMDSRNSFNHLNDKLKTFPSENIALLKQTSLYISDMRSLHNIANEYNLFSRVVDGKKDLAKIFSLIFYKNIYAQDYNLTDKKIGVLYSFINDYRQKVLHEEYFTSLDVKINALVEKLERLRKETASSDMDVRKEIICKFISQELWSIVCFATKQTNYPQNYSIINAETLHVSESDFISFFSRKEQLFIGYGSERNSPYALIDGTSVVGEYERRSKMVGSDKDIEYKKTRREIEEIKEEIKIRNAIPLSELIQKIGEVRFKEIAEGYIIKSNDPDIIDIKQFDAVSTGFRLGGFQILYFLFANGYIMQDFMMYRSIFKEGSISVNDNDYIKSVGRFASCQEVNDDFSLDDVKEVVLQLVEQHYIYREGALHHQIITHVMEYTNDRNNDFLSGMISKIFDMKPEQVIKIYDVLDSKFISEETFKRFLILSLEDNRYLDKMLAILELSEENTIKTKISVYAIAFVDPDASRDKNHYKNFIESWGYSLVSYLNDETLVPFMQNIKKVGVIYTDVTLPVTDLEIKALKFVVDNYMYNLDKMNYSVVVAGLLKHENITIEQVDKTPLSLVNDYELKSVREVIDNNLDVFVRDIFINSNESASTIETVLSEPSLDDKLRVEILRKMHFTLISISQFKDDLVTGEENLSYHDLFYRYDHVAPSWDALLAYIYEDCNLQVLTKYIEKYAKNLANRVVDVVHPDKYDLLYMKVICNDDLSDPAYAAVTNPIEIDVNYWDDRLSAANFLRIIKNNKLALDPQSFEKAYDRFGALNDGPEIYAFFDWFTQYEVGFWRDTDLYLQVDKEDAFLESLLIMINSSSEFSIEEKSRLLIKYKENSEDKFLDGLDLSHDVMLSMIDYSKNDNFRISLIIRLIKDGYDQEKDIKQLVDKLNDRGYYKLFAQKQATVTFTDSEVAEMFLNVLRDKSLIIDWSVRDVDKYVVSCSKYYR